MTDTKNGFNEPASEVPFGKSIENESETRGHRSRKSIWLVVGVGLVALVAVTVIVGMGSDGTNPDSGAPANTAAVERTDLVVTSSLDGTLGYGDAEQLVFRSSDDGVTNVEALAAGTVTAIAELGTNVDFGEILFEVDAQPVVLLEGSIPAYRAFHSRMSDGGDIEQLEHALVGLGFDPDGDITIDEEFTSATSDAIEMLQEAIGAETTGSLGTGQVVFSATPVHVANQLVAVGDGAGQRTPIIATSEALQGTVTSIVEGGSILEQGDVLVAIDGRPVVLVIGSVPVTRSMSLGTSGLDVEQLQAVLIDLGFAPDDGSFGGGVYDEATLRAVTAWQASIGADQDGVVNVGDIVVAAQLLRVGEVLVGVGDPINNGTPIMTTSVSETLVSVQLSTDDQDLVSVGDIVTVELPNGSAVDGEVTELGTVVLATQQGATYFDMSVTLEDPDAAQGLDQAPVDVIIVTDRSQNVLAIPVTGLLALAEGGYAVEVAADDGTTFLVGVVPGLFADGLVEVSASGLESGMEIVVP